MGNTKIEWTQAEDGTPGKVWNPIRGCRKVSEGCRNCFAMRQAHRFSGKGKPYEGLTTLGSNGPQWTGEVRCIEAMLDRPLRWKKASRIFVNSMSDLFHPDVPFEFIDKVFAVMGLCPQHVFQVLTKRPDRMREYLTDEERAPRIFIQAQELGAGPGSFPIPPFPNVHLGTSVESQSAADERIPHLLETPAAVRWLSMEPLLERVGLGRIKTGFAECTNVLSGVAENRYVDAPLPGRGLDWVVCGGESGPNARPMHPEWVRSLRDQCQAAGTPFFLKQMMIDGKMVKMPELDGKIWDEYPEGER